MCPFSPPTHVHSPDDSLPLPGGPPAPSAPGPVVSGTRCSAEPPDWRQPPDRPSPHAADHPDPPSEPPAAPSSPAPPASPRPAGPSSGAAEPPPSAWFPAVDADAPLATLVELAAADMAEAKVDDAILRVTVIDGRSTLAWFPLDGAHPLDMLFRFVAPPHWRAVGVSCRGWSHQVDRWGRIQGRTDEPPVNVTVLIDREGSAAGLLRTDQGVRALPGRPEGLVADACRRTLGLPTAPPPDSTEGLWALAWLDRIVETTTSGASRSGPTTWRRLVGLHPAVALLDPAAVPVLATLPTGPGALRAAATGLAEAWPWPRIRSEPQVIRMPWLDLTPRLAAWMDDGMWARWVLSGFPQPDDLRAAVHSLLAEPLAAAVDQVVERVWSA
jgi:hypothetical protein